MNGIFRIKIKQEYDVDIYPDGEGECTCMGHTFRVGGRKQRECKHIQQARAMKMKLEELQ